MGEILKDKWGVEVDNVRLWRARREVRGDLEDDHKKSWSKLRMYAEMVLRTNPGSIAKISSEFVGEPDENGTRQAPRFKRIFICYDGVKKGFLNGCRPFLGVDGCHLKGIYEGILLSAIALDANL
ncbi:hypothetical protein PanWU01x14_060270 [Parasponia andersonii]|uniref:Uncharacterized protein n=1 Tax=Parasponia andersonii TaxID=3476 RepID=A0A2P5DIT3_PARAD|nr:hypothetical protein PanWU01x14_060270 [Parasponia andersonii]